MTTMYWLAFAFGVLWGLWAGQALQRRSRLGRVSLPHFRRQRCRFSGDWLDLGRT